MADGDLLEFVLNPFIELRQSMLDQQAHSKSLAIQRQNEASSQLDSMVLIIKEIILKIEQEFNLCCDLFPADHPQVDFKEVAERCTEQL